MADTECQADSLECEVTGEPSNTSVVTRDDDVTRRRVARRWRSLVVMCQSLDDNV
jgi:hypothetical protein